MRTTAGLSAMLLAASLFFGAAASTRAAPASINVLTTAWNSGANSDASVFTNTLLPPLSNPTNLDTPSEVIFGNTITSGLGVDTFSSVPVDVEFSITQNSQTNTFVADAVITGKVSYDGISGSSTAHVIFTSLTDITTGQTVTTVGGLDPGSMQNALDLITPVGTVYVDYAQPIPFSAAPTTISGFLTPAVPELGSCTAMMSVLTGSGVLGLVFRRRNRK